MIVSHGAYDDIVRIFGINGDYRLPGATDGVAYEQEFLPFVARACIDRQIDRSLLTDCRAAAAEYRQDQRSAQEYSVDALHFQPPLLPLKSEFFSRYFLYVLLNPLRSLVMVNEPF